MKDGTSNLNQTDRERDSLLKSKKSLDQLKLARAQSDPLSPSKQGLKDEEDEDPDFGNEDAHMGTEEQEETVENFNDLAVSTQQS